MKGKTLETVFLIIGIVFMGIAVYVYVRAETNDSNTFATLARDLKSSNQAIANEIVQIGQNQNSINSRLDELESKINIPQQDLSPGPLLVKLAEPISINLVYRQAQPKIKPLIPISPINPKKNKSLLERAGIK